MTWLILILIVIGVVAVFGRPKKPKQSAPVPHQVTGPYSPQAPATPKSRAAVWVPAGEATTIAGIEISGGLFYLGSTLPGQVRGTCGNCVVDPTCKIAASRRDPEGISMPYWPSYQTISPEARRTYLEWLASGRSDPEIGIGYVFLYFYGIEHRLFVDRAFAEAETLKNEVERLVGIYGENRSFKGYAEKLLQILPLLTGAPNDVPVPSPNLRDGYEIPAAVKIYLGKQLLSGPVLAAHDALLWVMASPLTNIRTPVWRCFDELSRLWTIRFAQRYPKGLKVTVPKRVLKLTYRAASAGFEANIDPEVDGRKLPDIGVISAPLKGLQDLLTSCTEELAPYSRLLGRQVDAPGTLEAALLLPKPLLETGMAAGIVAKVESLLGEKPLALVRTSALIDLLQINVPEAGRLSAANCNQVSMFLDKLNIGLEPDRRYSGRNLSLDGYTALFRTTAGTEIAADAPAYQSAKSMVEVAALAAVSDGHVDPAEYESIKADIRALPGLGSAEKNRLVAYATALLKDVPGQQSALNKLKTLDTGAKSLVLKSATAAVLADGRTTPEEVRFLERLHKSLGQPAEDVYASLHKGAVVVEQPVTIQTEDRISGIPIPPPPEASAKTEAIGLSLDADRIKRIHEETSAVSKMLADIFTEDEPVRPPPPVTAEGTASGRFSGLDAQHAALLSRLADAGELSREAFEAAARELRLLPDGAIETINEWAFDQFDEPLVEGDDPVTVVRHLVTELMETA